MKLPTALKKAVKKDLPFWESLGDEIIELAIAGRAAHAEELRGLVFSEPNLKRICYAENFEAAADRLTAPEHHKTVQWLLAKAGDELEAFGGKRKQDEVNLDRLREKASLIEDIDKAVKALQEYALRREPAGIRGLFTERYKPIAARLAARFSTMDDDDLKAVAEDGLGNHEAADRLRLSAVAARLKTVDEWVAQPGSAAPVSEPENWREGIAQQQRLALAGRLNEASALLNLEAEAPDACQGALWKGRAVRGSAGCGSAVSS